MPMICFICTCYCKDLYIIYCWVLDPLTGTSRIECWNCLMNAVWHFDPAVSKKRVSALFWVTPLVLYNRCLVVLIGRYESGKNITSLENKINVFSVVVKKKCCAREYTFSKILLPEMLGTFSTRDFTLLKQSECQLCLGGWTWSWPPGTGGTYLATLETKPRAPAVLITLASAPAPSCSPRLARVFSAD